MAEADQPIERGVQRVVTGFVIFYTLNGVGAFATRVGELAADGLALIALSLALAAVLAVRGWRGRLTGADVVTSFFLLASTLGLNALWHTAGIGVTGGPAYGGMGIALFVQVVTMPPIRFVFASVVTVLAYAGVRGLMLGLTGIWDGIDEGTSHVGFMAAFAVALIVLRRADRTADRALENEVRAESERMSVRANEVALRESQRILHDDVIAALVTIKLWQDADRPAAVKAAAVRAREAFMPDESGKAAILAPGELAHPLSLTISYDTDDARDPIDPTPPHVAASTTLATMEALRNIERHAGVTHAHVHRRTAPDGSVTVTIRDEGAGFDPEHRRGFGITHGIVGRMAEVGGGAQISTAPGEGTVVKLFWSAADGANTHAGPVPITHQLLRRAPLITLAVLIGQTWLPLRHIWSEPHPWILLGTAAVSAAISLLIARDVSRSAASGPSLSRGLLAVVAQLALLVLNLSLVGPDGLPTFASWIVEYVEVTLIVVGLALAPFVAIGGALTMATGIFTLAVLSPAVTLDGASATIMEPLLVAGGATGIAVSVRRAQRAIVERRRSALEAGWLARTTLDTTRELVTRLDHLRGTILPFLDGIIEGRLAIGDATTQEQARLLEAEARDELYLHDLLDDDLRALLRTARLRGCEITIRSTDDALAGDRAAQVLRIALDPEHTDRAVMVLPRAGSPEMRLRMSPPLAADRVSELVARLAHLDPHVASDTETTTVSVSVAG